MASKSPSSPTHPNIAQYNEHDSSFTDYCTSRGFPLGGIGTGGFNLLTDGGFGKFRTNHNWFRFVKALDFPKGTFLALRWKNSGAHSVHSRILRRNYQGGPEFTNMTAIPHTKFIGKLPHCELHYSDPILPYQVSLEGCTPLIPQNLKDSSLPLALFTFNISNPTDQSVEIALLFAFENLLGLGGSGSSPLLLRDGPVTYRSTKGNYAEPFDTPQATGIAFKTTQDYHPRDPHRRVVGSYFIFTDNSADLQEAMEVSHCSAWSSKSGAPKILDDFHSKGTIQSEYSDSKARTNAGAFCLKTTLSPGETRSIPLYVMWWTPYHVLEKNQRIYRLLGHHQGTDFGHYYLNFFERPEDLVDYAITHRKRMITESRVLESILGQSSLPSWLQTYILNSTDSMLVNTCLSKDGRMYVIEGCPWDWPFGGLTGTIDQRLVSHAYSATFLTEFDKAELLTFQELMKGDEVPHGNGHCDVMLHSTNVPYGMPLKIYNKTNVWTDLPQSFILQFGKLVMTTGDLPLLERIWPDMVKMMEFLERASLDGIPEGITTYDYAYYRPHFIYTAGLQLATLKMMIFLGNQLLKFSASQDPSRHLLNGPSTDRTNIQNLLAEYQQRYELCSETMETRLWMKEGYYRTCGPKNTVFTSALAGDWIMRYAGLSPVFEYTKAHSHANWQQHLLVDSHDIISKKGKKSRPLVYRETDLEGNEILVKDNLFVLESQVNNPWQVLGFMAFEWIYLGKEDAGLAVVKRIWEKGYYEGYPWDMDHWGFPGHIYMSHPVMWAIFNALTGMSLDLLNHTLTISPRPSPNLLKEGEMKIPVFFPTVWFWFSYEVLSSRVFIEVLRSFTEGQKIHTIFCTNPEGKRMDITLEEPFALKVGEQMEVDFPYPPKIPKS